MGSHCGGRVPRHKGGSAPLRFPDLKQLPSSGVETPYSPSLTGRLAANGHPTAGASISRMGEDRAASRRFPREQ
ncbi:MAG: hypothetical protein V7K40_21380 [Nostoc sp.]|uniref:hypothetical protein n=1 Tax=Nostoc sp. TaxID=1180 RepID=UPI002FF811F2